MIKLCVIKNFDFLSYHQNFSLKRTKNFQSYKVSLLVHFFNPISHEVGPLWPTQLESVHHFHRSWTIDTKIHDFVSFHIFQLPVMPFLTFFSKYLKNLGFGYLRGPGAFDENKENFVFSIFLKEMLIFQTKCEFCRFLAFF